MLKRASLVLFILLAITCTTAEAQRAIILVRHAEKLDNSVDSPLSSKGEDRAARLANQLKDAGVSAIYTTQFIRTNQTVEHLAKLLGVTPVAIPMAEQSMLLKRLRTRHKNDVVLIVGHSSTVPKILKALGAKEQVTIAEDEYNDLFVFIPGRARILLHLHY